MHEVELVLPEAAIDKHALEKELAGDDVHDEAHRLARGGGPGRPGPAVELVLEAAADGEVELGVVCDDAVDEPGPRRVAALAAAF